MGDKEVQKATNFDLGFTPETFSTLPAEDGTGFKRVRFGHYTLKIVDGEIIPTKNAKKPHNMLKPTFEVVKAHDAENDGEVGSTADGLYGTATSPDYMQKRFKQLCEACKVVPGKTGLKFSQLVGKQFDATLVWELSDSGKLDDFGNKKFYVNVRVKAERPVGSPAPKTFNPAAESRRAVQYLESLAGAGGEGAAGGTGGGEGAPWEAPAADGGNGEGAGADAPASFMPEESVEPTAHEYRAIYKLNAGSSDGDEAKEALINAGVDPEGPVNVEHLTAETRTAYEAKFGGGNGKKKLPPLGAPKGAGTRQPRA